MFSTPAPGSIRSADRDVKPYKRSFDFDDAWKPRASGLFEVGTDGRSYPAGISILRRRARALAATNAFAQRAIDLLVNHAVSGGIRVSIDGSEDFAKWMHDRLSSTDFDYNGDLNFYTTQAVTARELFEAGDVMVVRRSRNGRGEPMRCYQVIDTDRLDSGAAATRKGSLNIAGVQVDESGNIEGYHVAPAGTGYLGGNNKTVFVKKDDCFFLLERKKPAQVRGLPRGVNAIERAGQADKILELSMQRAQVEATFGAVITAHSDDMETPIDSDEEGYDPIDSMSLAPGSVYYLNHGENVEIIKPSSTAGGMKDYMKVGLEAVAVAHSVTYEQLTSDNQGANFSSLKAGKVEFFVALEHTRKMDLLPFYKAIAEDLANAYEIETGRPRGKIKLITPERASYDALKDINAHGQSIRLGVASWQEVAAQRGRDPEELAEEIGRGVQILKDAGVWDIVAGSTFDTTLLQDEDD